MRYPNEATNCFIDGLPLEPLPDPRLGTLVAGKYVLDAVIGEGGMATVYAGHHAVTEAVVAVKVMNALLAYDKVVRERFRREAENARRLAHPNIIDVYDHGDLDDTSFIAMERLVGETLGAVIARGAIPPPRALRLMMQLASGLARAHDLGVVHRDLKPDNIFVVRDQSGHDLVKILDFGIAHSQFDARLTAKGELFGTPQYLAPERIGGEEPTASSDLYSLGVLFFEMLANRLPFETSDPMRFLVLHIVEAPPDLATIAPKTPPAMSALVMSLLSKDPKDRPVDAHHLVRKLGEIARAMNTRATNLRVDMSPSQAPPSMRLPAPNATIMARWTRRTTLLEDMLARAFGTLDRAPAELVGLLNDMRRTLSDLEIVRGRARELQEKLDGIEQRGRDGRASRDAALNQLAEDLSREKEQHSTLAGILVTSTEGVATEKKAYRACLDEIVQWEGRTAMSEPHVELAEAYRRAATHIYQWRTVKTAREDAEKSIGKHAAAAEDLAFQIEALRAALAAHETAVARDRDACAEQISDVSRKTEALENELSALTTKFTEPLRGRTDLEPLFKELERVRAA